MEIIYQEAGLFLCRLGSEDYSALQDLNEIRTYSWTERNLWEKLGEGQAYERDEYDAHSVYFAVMCGERVVGGFRIIGAETPNELPFAKYCSHAQYSGWNHEEVLEISRWCVDNRVAKRSFRAAHVVMIKGCLKYLCSRSIDIAYMDVCSFLFKILAGPRLNIKLSQLGDEHARPDGSTFIPAALDVFASAQAQGLVESRVCA